MKRETQSELLRIACWMLVVILPTALICWLAGIRSVAAIGVALPLILVAERVYRRLLQRFGLWGIAPDSDRAARTNIEPGAPPNGGPAAPIADPEAPEGPPSVN